MACSAARAPPSGPRCSSTGGKASLRAFHAPGQEHELAAQAPAEQDGEAEAATSQPHSERPVVIGLDQEASIVTVRCSYYSSRRAPTMLSDLAAAGG